jgi:N utilization substance protein B
MKASPRRVSREFALQGMYQWLFTQASPAQILKNLAELEGFADADKEFLKAELKGTIGVADELRALVEPIADRKWDEVSPVERSILLIAAWELVHNPEIPYRVTINEAIELGKRFGGTDGHKYVNGVLDKLAAAVRPEEVARPPRERGAASNTRRKKNG